MEGVCGEDSLLFPLERMVDCGNTYAFSKIFCLLLLGYLDPYQSSIGKQIIKSSSSTERYILYN